MTIEEAIKNREECLKYLEGLGAMATPENVEAARWSLKALRAYAEKPPCYLEEKDNPYPLCVGRGFANCAHCCLWADFDEGQDEGRVNPPLTMDQLRGMSGEPVWTQRDLFQEECRYRVISEVYDLKLSFTDGSWLFFSDFGKSWLAFRSRPEEVQHETD